MSSINVLNIIVLNPNAKFTDDLKFEIVFECLAELKKEIEWKVIYIGSADDDHYDQELESVEIGPLQLGTMKFQLDAACPDYKKIPEGDVLGVTAILICCSYNNQEFFRCGYYLNNMYDNEDMNLNQPENVQIEHVVRSILADKPRITKFNIDWDNESKQIPVYKNENNMFKDGKIAQEQFKQMINDKNNNSNPFDISQINTLNNQNKP